MAHRHTVESRRGADHGRPTSPCAERSTTRTTRTPCTPTTHLRLRGEHGERSASAFSNSDPPPPARRARYRRRRRRPVDRPTSACAESTPHLRTRSPGRATHLRLRGEHDPGALGGPGASDPPPPARRARRGSGASGRLGRPASACAESTAPPPRGRVQEATHLRLRGEHSSRRPPSPPCADPPPPARRAPRRGAARQRPTRPTSACAESTPSRPAPSCWSATHLRLRGEHGSFGGRPAVVSDPPPPARRAPLPARR